MKQQMIAYFIIFIQGFILAHTFVPHHHHHTQESSCFLDVSDYHHKHYHAHTADDHHDENRGIFDILFSNMHHSQEGVIYVAQQDVHFLKQDVLKQNLTDFTIQQPVTIKYLIGKPITYEHPALTHYNYKYKQNFSLRGPPFFIV